MPHADASSLTLALALLTGVTAQALAQHLRLPGIVVLLSVGVLLGPDVAGLIQPDSLGGALQAIVGFAVAVILFEGGLNLSIDHIRRAGGPIRRLITLGALITAVGGTLTALLVLGWPWRQSLLFGTLVIVTGPTVITPLLRRVRVEETVATVLEAEGVLIDAVGAIVAVVALEVAISPSGDTVLHGLLAVASRLGLGSVVGLAGGAVLALALRRRGVVPEGLENVFALSAALLMYHGANAVLSESGLAAATVAGIVVGNSGSHVHRSLVSFKEQLTVLLIGMLFVLLAADVRLADVEALGVRGLLAVAALVLVVRPATVAACTAGSDLTVRQRAFVAWIGPRGIVAAAVASLFAVQLDAHGLAGGGQLRAMVFLVIAVTVVLSGVTGGAVAQLLGLRVPTDQGWVILGGNPLGRALSRTLLDSGEDVVCVDTNPKVCALARRGGVQVIAGNGLEEETLAETRIHTRTGAIGLTPNEEVNFLFVNRARREGRLRRLYVALRTDEEGITSRMAHERGVRVLFGGPCEVGRWGVRLEDGDASVERWRLVDSASDASDVTRDSRCEGLVLPMAVTRAGRTTPYDDQTKLSKGDEVQFALGHLMIEATRQVLRERGWALVEAAEAPEALEAPEAIAGFAPLIPDPDPGGTDPSEAA